MAESREIPVTGAGGVTVVATRRRRFVVRPRGEPDALAGVLLDAAEFVRREGLAQAASITYVPHATLPTSPGAVTTLPPPREYQALIIEWNEEEVVPDAPDLGRKEAAAKPAE